MTIWFHLFGATIWVGGHLVLALVILPNAWRTKSLQSLQEFETLYEKIGIPALILQVVTGLWLAYERSPQLSRWIDFTTPTLRVIPIKLSLLLLTVLLAIHARFWIWPSLTLKTLPIFSLHVGVVTILAVALMTLGLGFRLGWF